MNKPKGKTYGDTSGATSGVGSGLSEASRFKSSDVGPAEETKAQRPKSEDTPSRKVVK